jgi:hypothetical protein
LADLDHFVLFACENQHGSTPLVLGVLFFVLDVRPSLGHIDITLFRTCVVIMHRSCQLLIAYF